MIEKTSIVNAQFKLIIPKEIRNNVDIKVGTVVKWTVKDDDIDKGKVTIEFINV